MTKEVPHSTKLEAGMINVLGGQPAKIDESSLAAAVRHIASSLDGMERQKARFLAYAIADALDQDSSYWKLTLSRPGVKGPHKTNSDYHDQWMRDVEIAYIVQSQLVYGIKKEAAKQVAMTKFGIKASTVDDAIARVNGRLAAAFEASKNR
jgi:hypothetical protein